MGNAQLKPIKKSAQNQTDHELNNSGIEEEQKSGEEKQIYANQQISTNCGQKLDGGGYWPGPSIRPKSTRWPGHIYRNGALTCDLAEKC